MLFQIEILFQYECEKSSADLSLHIDLAIIAYQEWRYTLISNHENWIELMQI